MVISNILSGIGSFLSNSFCECFQRNDSIDEEIALIKRACLDQSMTEELQNRLNTVKHNNNDKQNRREIKKIVIDATVMHAKALNNCNRGNDHNLTSLASPEDLEELNNLANLIDNARNTLLELKKNKHEGKCS